MATTTRRIGRRFPDYGWAWPTNGLDRLLKAVLLPDQIAAQAQASKWLDANDIDAVEFREHRLLAAIADRFGKALAAHPAYPRLAGLQKMLWTKSRLAMREAEPALKAMVGAGAPIMLLKGASRIAVEPAAQRGRVAHDIDILVRPEHMAVAFDVLRQRDWKVSTGVSPQYLRPRLGAVRSMNFFMGSYGDIDLHQAAYDWSQADDADDEAVWRRALPATFSGLDVLVPSAADRVALAIGHGGLDAHTHSDWLVDSAVAIRACDIDWAVFCEVIARRHLAVPAAVALTYLEAEMSVPVPSDVLERIVAMADRAGASRIGSLLQAKPRTDFKGLTWLSRGVAKQLRMRKKRALRERELPGVEWHGRRAALSAEVMPDGFALSQRLQVPRQFASGEAAEIEIVVRLDAPPMRRRIEMELNGGEHHFARLRYRKLGKSGGAMTLRFRGTIRPAEADGDLTLAARPSRQFRDWEHERTVATYGAVPFQVVSVKVSPAP
ncbi:nucleotidyltransferase family protein [Aminobacter anthyllidis]|uniref:nucleotidyltransferase family protein n=1 Tax=Aminobacter anthyllidis TaxID=1035067 RepID=UPI00245757A5|nr:nucleotidyltransferase family protein [Aminobacter anthyllidis]MDH4988028.1 nucleotidyltransferase family protein [Aminobacter anthyllidis]